MTGFFNAIGDFFTWTFQFMPSLGNIPNLIIGLCIGAGTVYWLGQMRKHNREDAAAK